jgi:hypothetical protein
MPSRGKNCRPDAGINAAQAVPSGTKFKAVPFMQ